MRRLAACCPSDAQWEFRETVLWGMSELSVLSHKRLSQEYRRKMKISQRLHKLVLGVTSQSRCIIPWKGHTTWEMMRENKLLGSWSRVAGGCLYVKILELYPERIPEIHTTRRLKPPFITSGFKYSPHRQTNSQKPLGQIYSPVRSPSELLLECLSLSERVRVPEGRRGRLLTGNDCFISGKSQRRDVRCRAGLGCGWGRMSERQRLRFPPVAGKEEGTAVLI